METSYTEPKEATTVHRNEAVRFGNLKQISLLRPENRSSSGHGDHHIGWIHQSVTSVIFPLVVLTQVPGGQGWRRGGGRLRWVGVEDGAVGFVIDQVGHESTLLILDEAGGVTARRAQTGLEVGVAARGIAADRPLVSAVGAGLRGAQFQ